MAIKIEDLKDTDIGREVTYQDGHKVREYGRITSWNKIYIFVDYHGKGSGIATPPERLSF